MTYRFNMELRSQQEWSWQVALDLFLGGLGGGLFLLYQGFHLPLFTALISLGLVVLGGIVLLSELGRPGRAWRAIFRPSTSWISRGVLCVSVFIVAGALYLAPSIAVFSWLPWSAGGVVGRTLWYVAGLSALLITLYPGFLLAASRSIPFWNTPLLPLLFLIQAVLGASGILLLLSPFSSFQRLTEIEALVIALIVVNLLMMAVYPLSINQADDPSGAASKGSLQLLSGGPLGWTFRIGVILLGMVLPLLVVLRFQSAVVLAGLGVLIGGLLFRYCLLKSGVYLPPALVGRDMSKLNRADDELALEYANMAARHAP